MFRGLFFISPFQRFFGCLPFGEKLGETPLFLRPVSLFFLVAFFCKNLNFRLPLRGDGVSEYAAALLCMA